MSSASQFRGARRVNSLVGQTGAVAGFPAGVHGARSSAITNVTGWQTVLSISGRGAVNLAAFRSGASVLGSARITVDGRLLATVSSVSLTSGQGLCLVGSVIKSYDTGNDCGGFCPQPIGFMQSLLVEWNTSTVATTSVLFFTNYELDV